MIKIDKHQNIRTSQKQNSQYSVGRTTSWRNSNVSNIILIIKLILIKLRYIYC